MNTNNNMLLWATVSALGFAVVWITLAMLLSDTVPWLSVVAGTIAWFVAALLIGNVVRSES